jgi:hypothetical protein
MFRTAIAAAIGLTIVSAAAASETSRGAYASLTTRDAAACARACADDGICMAWTFLAENQCELSAVVAASENTHAVAFGYASRAPASLQRSTPLVHPQAADLAAPPQPAPQTLAAVPDEAPAPSNANEDDAILLGGPLEGDLRLGLR